MEGRIRRPITEVMTYTPTEVGRVTAECRIIRIEKMRERTSITRTGLGAIEGEHYVHAARRLELARTSNETPRT